MNDVNRRGHVYATGRRFEGQVGMPDNAAGGSHVENDS